MSRSSLCRSAAFAALLAVCSNALPRPDFDLLHLAAPDVDVIPGATPESGEVDHRVVAGTVPSTGRSFTGYLAVASDYRWFSVQTPAGGCSSQRAKTSVTASHDGCVYATNGGFFSFTAKDFCIGNVISDGHVEQLSPNAVTSLGVSSAGQILVGVQNAAAWQGSPLTQLISGVGWLVRGGALYYQHSADLNVTSGFFTEKAPRTAVGAFANGTVGYVAGGGWGPLGGGAPLTRGRLAACSRWTARRTCTLGWP